MGEGEFNWNEQVFVARNEKSEDSRELSWTQLERLFLSVPWRLVSSKRRGVSNMMIMVDAAVATKISSSTIGGYRR